ncbi:MAG TPA: TolC family protein [Opitutaceae bacterium]
MPAAAARYVEEAFTRNLALQARTLDVESARARLAEARSAYQPRLDFVARYSVADGGRTIDVPVGDLLNGVYRTLNDYLRSQGQPAAFAPVENQSISLLREHEQETKLRLTQPLYRPAIPRGVRAQKATLAARDAQLAAYRRELRLAVLSGYYGYLQAEAAVATLDSAERLTAEAVRANRLLLETDRVTEDRLLRAEADALAVRQQRAEAERDRNLARSYFNFLLNRPLELAIEHVSDDELRGLTEVLLAVESSGAPGPDRREELVALQHAVAAASAAEDAVRARFQPALDLAVEGGIQGENYRTGGDANFVQGSLVASVNLWDGRERRSQLQQARIERRRAELELEDTRQQLALQVQQASDEFAAATAAHRTATRRREAARRVFELVTQREREGLVNQLSFLDARNELTRAELNDVVTRQRLFIAAAALDRAAALSPLP